MKILVVGDSMLDVYWSGKISRLNPESHRAPLVSVSSRVERPGGAANVAANLQALGVQTTLLSGLGNIYKNRVVDEDGVVCRFDVEEPLLPLPIASLPNEKFDAIVVADYAKGSIELPLATAIVEKYDCPLFVDTKSYPAPWIDAATCLFPNASEFNKHPYDYKLAKLVLLKRGKDGSMFLRSGVLSEKFLPTAKYVINPSGAGDTVMASFAAAYCSISRQNLRGRAEIESLAADFAMHMAAVVVQHKHTHAPTLDEMVRTFPDLALSTAILAIDEEAKLCAP